MRALALVMLAGCFDPTLTAHLPCAQPDNWCPPPQTCGSDGFCEGGPGSGDDAGPGVLPEANLVFTTSEPLSLGAMANADIIAMADAKCQTLGTKLRPGTYKAWLGTDPPSAAARLPSSVSWARIDGRPFTTSLIALQAQGQVFYPPRLDDDRQDVPAQRMDTFVVTGLPMADGCMGGDNTVVSGSADGDDPDWYFSQSGLTCASELYVYCFETDRTVSVPTPTRDPSKLYAFVTGAFYTIQGGVDQLDADCQASADGASLGRRFHALVAPTGATPRSRFMGSMKPWSRLDGVIVANPDLADFIAPLSVNEYGLHTHVDVAFGANSTMGQGVDATNCLNWASSVGGTSAGRSTRSSSKAFSGFGITCASAHLYCLEIP